MRSCQDRTVETQTQTVAARPVELMEKPDSAGRLATYSVVWLGVQSRADASSCSEKGKQCTDVLSVLSIGAAMGVEEHLVFDLDPIGVGQGGG